jgi:hypothetical protein
MYVCTLLERKMGGNGRRGEGEEGEKGRRGKKEEERKDSYSRIPIAK